MRSTYFGAGLVAIVLLGTPSGTCAQRKFGRFDRLAAVQSFLDEVYPGLRHVYGLMLSRSNEFHLARPEDFDTVGQQVDVVPCRPGSGVVGGREEAPSTLPYCAGLFPSGLSDFLTLSVGYSLKFPIWMFRAQGSFVEGKSQTAKEEIADHAEWTREKWTEAVIRSKPALGPNQREDFLRSIPVQAIGEFTGCRLDPATASFWVDRLGEKPDPIRVEIQWIVRGKTRNKRGGHSDGCQATFEPFEGKLLSVN